MTSPIPGAGWYGKAMTQARARPKAGRAPDGPVFIVLRHQKRLSDMNIFNYVFQSLDGEPLPLDRFRGQLIFLVNTASHCGYTPQYAKLQRFYENYRKSGLTVIAMPCNDFGAQEPGTAEEIASFCETNYAVRFPITAKYPVLGRDAHPLFVDLLDIHGPDILPKWNFYKYFFARDGELIAHWPSKMAPDDLDVIRTVEQNLGSWSL